MDHLEFEAEEVHKLVTHQKLSTKDIVIDLLAGTVAGITSTWAGYPLDLIKFRLQIQPELKGAIMAGYRQIRSEGGGVRAFFRGVWSPALGNIPINALIFASNGICNKYIESRQSLAMTENTKIYISGCFAGLMSLIAFVPTELIKIRIQDNHNSTSNSVYRQVIQEIYSEGKGGIRSFYKGFWPQFWRDVPTYGIYFLAYNLYQKLIFGDNTSQDSQISYKVFMGKMLAGGLAGMTTWFFAYPFDVVKSIVQSSTFNFEKAGLSMHGSSILAVTRYLYKTHGPHIFFHGLGSCLARAFIVNAFCFVTYEWCVQAMNSQ
ncbi:hypothetical protein FGO68_gene1330 [Halteria grandinella]|uniref:Carrier protein n=1 Tax=Halteria grandinella TaxID=5974 RepID=A0A8J8NKA4_HALGN|nr:hypothetical protein FGO68_gene1330 [Halteria grandinella]